MRRATSWREISQLSCCASQQLKQEVDVVGIFRRAKSPPVVDEAIQLHRSLGRPRAIWMRLGVVSEVTARRAKEAGLEIAMDRCMKIEHARRFRGSS